VENQLRANLTADMTVNVDFSVLHSYTIQILTDPVNHRVGMKDDRSRRFANDRNIIITS
jgi:hypothetical protein